LFSQDSHATEAMYLEGFGSLFLIGVDFPLSAPPEVQAEQADQGVDPVWNQMKRDIYYPDDTSRRKRQEEQKEYDADKVQDLQRTLVRALKHAANIRGLKSDESVTIMVRGGEASMILTATNTGRTTGGKIVTQQAAHPEPTFLTIRAQKTDIDSFAKDKLPYDQFRQRVQTIIY
jgi:hypothetical protein